jgi:hypothetical protein
MTRKDYQLIAEVFANLGQIIDIKETVAVDLARNLADALETDNPRFDRDRFLKACGVTTSLTERMFTPEGKFI